MTFYRFTAALCVAAFFSVSPVLAQDHSDHQAGHQAMKMLSAPAKAKTCECCKNKQCPMMQNHTEHVAHEAQQPSTPAEKELAAAMTQMHQAMDKPYTGDADADFIRGMIPHHQGAVEMARIVLKYGDDPEAKKLARRIIVAQKGEIAWMQRWLAYRQIPENGAFSFNR